jgi:hypothetical protein
MSSWRALPLLLIPAVAFAGATASSFRPEARKGANFWNASSAIDGNKDTAWMVPGESPNRGEWIMLELPKSTVEKIGMYVGWVKNDTTFKDYGRIKSVKLEGFSLDDAQDFTPAGNATAVFADKADWQIVPITPISVGQDLFGGKIKIHVVDIYPGEDYPNFAVSELLVYLKEFDSDLKVTTSSDAVNGTSAANMSDDNPKTYWATAASTASLTVENSDCGLSSIGFAPGPKNLARVKTVEVTANNRTDTYTLADDPKGTMQWFDVPSITGYNGGAFGAIEIRITETYPGTEPNVAISEIGAKATNCGGF